MNARFVPTSQHTIGPFFPTAFFQDGDNDLTRLTAEAAPTTRGERIRLRGRVTKAEGEPVVNGVLELWQADAEGRFRHSQDPGSHEADPDFLGWGRAWTDAEGEFTFTTVLPGAYSEGNMLRAPHANVLVMGSGLMRPVSTTIFFPDFTDLNGTDPVLDLVPDDRRHRLVARDEGEVDGLRTFRFDIVLRGSRDEETPFFAV